MGYRGEEQDARWVARLAQVTGECARVVPQIRARRQARVWVAAVAGAGGTGLLVPALGRVTWTTIVVCDRIVEPTWGLTVLLAAALVAWVAGTVALRRLHRASFERRRHLLPATGDAWLRSELRRTEMLGTAGVRVPAVAGAILLPYGLFACAAAAFGWSHGYSSWIEEGGTTALAGHVALALVAGFARHPRSTIRVGLVSAVLAAGAVDVVGLLLDPRLRASASLGWIVLGLFLSSSALTFGHAVVVWPAFVALVHAAHARECTALQDCAGAIDALDRPLAVEDVEGARPQASLLEDAREIRETA